MAVTIKREPQIVEEANKIRRPPNAFMIYANENRKQMAFQHPTDSNKEISKKLGSSWRRLEPEDKEKYFLKARAADIAHKLKYPNYVYNPQEARMRKAMRDANRDRSIGASPMLPRPSARRATPSYPGWPPSSIEEPPHQPMTHLGPPPGMQRPTCYTPHPSSDQYLPLSSFNKFSQHHQPPPQISRQVPPPTPTPVPPPAPPTNYLQPNPLAQLQQQTEMWHNYQDDVRPQSRIGSSYMMPEAQPHPYQHHQPSPPLSIPSPLTMDKHRQTPLPLHPLMTTPPLPQAAAPVMPMTPPHSINSNMSMTPPHSNENLCPEEPLLPPPVKQQRIASQQPQEMGVFKQEADVLQPVLDNNIQVKQGQQEDGSYMRAFGVHMEDVKAIKSLDSHVLEVKDDCSKLDFHMSVSCKRDAHQTEERKSETSSDHLYELNEKNVSSFNQPKFIKKYGLQNMTHLEFLSTPLGILPIAFIDNKSPTNL